MLLEAWAYQLRLAFGEVAYLVGTAARGKTWRDVDVRIMFDHDQYVELLGEKANPDRHNHRWAAICTALSVWGQQQTGLPIDFQFQEVSEANDKFGGEVRVPLIALAQHG